MPRLTVVCVVCLLIVGVIAGNVADARPFGAVATKHYRLPRHAAPHRPAMTMLLGNRRVERAQDRAPAGLEQAFRVTARASGTTTHIAVYIDRRSHASHVNVVLYADRRGRPGRRITSGTLRSPRAGQWDYISVRRASVHAGRRYWLAILAARGTLFLRDRHRGGCRRVTSRPHNLRALKAVRRAEHRVKLCAMSAYAGGILAAKHGGPSGGTPPSPVSPPSSSGLPPSAPPPRVPQRPPCTTTVASMSALSTLVATAPGGTVICIAPGSYTGMSVSGAHASDVVIEPAPSLDPNGAGLVTIGLSSSLTDGFGNRVAANVAPNSSHIVLLDLHFTNELSIADGSSNITVDHNDFTQVGNGGGEMINFATSDCTAPNAPSWSGCSPEPPVSNVTITGNRFHGIDSQGDDVLHTNNFRNLTITANEITGAVENNAGGHVDCLQNVYGGQGLLFAYNYEHDNECQGFFVKDGDTSNITYDDNLFVRDTLPATNGGSSYSSSQLYNANGFVAERNTIWDGKGFTLRCSSSSVPCRATMDHNAIYMLNNGNRGDPTFFSLSESYNLFATSGFNASSGTDQTNAHAGFACGSSCGNGTVAGDDYRLSPNPSGIGIDWAPSLYTYGPG